MEERIALEEIARQMSIQNRLVVSRELFKIGYYTEEDYTDALRDIDDDLRFVDGR